MSRTRYRILEKSAVHFLTFTVVNWLPIFAKPEPKVILADSLQFLQDKDRLSIFAYVIMENHMHLIAQSDDLPAEIRKYKSYTARKIIDLLKDEGNTYYLKQLRIKKNVHHHENEYQLWQEGSHPQLIQGHKMMIQKIGYIHNNPVRRGYVDLPVHWRYSSARNYEEMEGVIDMCTVW